ncbi:FG-GAP repeat domain-containing protein [Mucilaginibacter ginkgonis]|uniref:VCBS repeat-containing protein n=1 Tax=Mucilaginibacter ginkgonis TaxID=2682091 RepID=A0A6I4I3M7_9SPHI|nr:VCBS repeat-containing protein [Mucilaginibacter ginkgonis]QQL48649.1 VCBS repeat-containing protein [Mucilaginibacter ginkgonis]
MFNLKKFLPAVFIPATLAIVSGITIYSCNQDNAPKAQSLDGRTLATKYCTSCHKFTEPALADKKSWRDGILPAMAKRLNLEIFMGQAVVNPNSTVSLAQWQAIEKWYISNAPDSLVIPKPAKAPARDWDGFTLVRPKIVNTHVPAMTTMVAVSPDDHKLYSGDAANGFYSWTPDLKQTLVYNFDSPVTGIDFVKQGERNVGVITGIGQMMPVDVSKGKVYELTLPVTGKAGAPRQITDSLPRPVQTVTADFNKDGLPDYVVCGFGHDRGGLYYIEQKPAGKYNKKVMLGIPGGTQLLKGDFNNDGWPDVMCLFAQNEEAIWLFTNDHKGGFTQKRILQFPPIYGSGSFQLVDMNGDGKLDILYCCGDNSDYSRVLKPYHGLYIFTNQGGWNFRQTYFYHIDGGTKAVAIDFDGDGKPDIAAIAFFSDFKYHPEEGFTYLHQESANKFTPHNIPVEKYGRWICMDVHDVDGDGKPDIVLGNFSIGQRGLLNQKGVKPQWDQNEPLIVLKNNFKQAGRK